MKEQVLHDEGLNTLMGDVEAVINSRPISTVSSYCRGLSPIAPNHLLTLKENPLCVKNWTQMKCTVSEDGVIFSTWMT